MTPLDLIIDDAVVHTMDPKRPTAHRLGVWGGRIVGLDHDLDDTRSRHRVSLAGRTVLPGFVDAHTHLVWQGLDLTAVDVSEAPGIEGVLAAIDVACRRAGTAWVDVSGYDQRKLGRHLTAGDLDPVSHGRALAVKHISGHATVVNSKVLEAVASQSGPAPAGVVLDAAGAPTGLLSERAQDLLRECRPPHTLASIVEALRRSGERCAAQGVTFCAEAGVGGGLVHFSPHEAAAFQLLADAGELSVRVQLMVAADALRVPEGDPNPLASVGPGLSTGFGDDTLSLGAAKFWLDGGMSARTAALTEPYAGIGGLGDLTPDLERWRATAVAAHAGGWQLALHAIGDRAVDAALDIIEACQRARARGDARHRIEHAGLVRPDQLERMASLGAVAVIQPDFLRCFGDDYAELMGPIRRDWLYRGRSLLESGVPLAGSSDRPVTAGAPLDAVSFMVSRRSRSGSTIGPDEHLTVDDALRAYTVGAAYACRMDHLLGSITPGKLADLVILPEDPHRMTPADLGELPVQATMMGGVARHDPDRLLPDPAEAAGGTRPTTGPSRSWEPS